MGSASHSAAESRLGSAQWLLVAVALATGCARGANTLDQAQSPVGAGPADAGASDASGLTAPPDATTADEAAVPSEDAGEQTPDAQDERCPDGEFASGVDADGTLRCTAFDADAIRDAFNAQCSIVLGWRDSCDDCSQSPEKWGRASGTECDRGVGGDSSCITANLSGEQVRLYGLNTDGEINGDDKFYVGFDCSEPGQDSNEPACGPGTFVSGLGEDGPRCTSTASAVAQYANTHCFVYLGWRDSCSGCTTPPEKWGYAGQSACMNGAGGDNSCNVSALGDRRLQTFGLNTDGTVNDDDQFYIGLSCDDGTPSQLEGDPPDEPVDGGACPAGQLVVGLAAEGGALCASPSVEIADVVRSDCSAYLGWLDSCDDCAAPPSKWGRASSRSCESGSGDDGVCTIASLGGRTVQLYGVNTDGKGNGDDKFFVGMSCAQGQAP